MIRLKEKSRYEIGVNLLKTGDELIDIYADLSAKYPRIDMIIDPFLKTVSPLAIALEFWVLCGSWLFFKDQLNWYKLNAKISKSCFVANSSLVTNESLINHPPAHELQDITETATPRPNQSNSSLSTQEPLLMPVNFLKYENTATVSDTAKHVSELRSRGLQVGYTCSSNEPDDGFLADLVSSLACTEADWRQRIMTC